MSEPLTREETTYFINSLSRRNYENHDEHMKICKGLFDTYAALRRQLEERNKQIDELNEEIAWLKNRPD